jgi:hypothetical protein
MAAMRSSAGLVLQELWQGFAGPACPQGHRAAIRISPAPAAGSTGLHRCRRNSQRLPAGRGAHRDDRRAAEPAVHTPQIDVTDDGRRLHARRAALPAARLESCDLGLFERFAVIEP